jgi:hypothetical protein
MVFKGRDLLLNKGGADIPLFEFGISDGCVVHLVLALRGGAGGNGSFDVYLSRYTSRNFPSPY